MDAHQAIAASLALALAAAAATSCGTKENVATEGTGPLATASAAAPPALDANAIAAATGGSAETSGAVVKVSFPRTDTPVKVDGFEKLPPYMGLTSWVAFMPRDNDRAMAMGDIVLFQDEVNPAMSAALDHGLEVTALHNHFFFDEPKVYFMHVGGMGAVHEIGAGVKAMMDTVKSIRQHDAKPRETFGGAPISGPSRVDAAKLDDALGVKGTAHDGMYKATFGRTVTSAMCGGCSIGSAMGINTWAAFAGTDEDAVVDGDFAITEDELQPVLKALRAGDIDIVAIHSHMTGENPRILFFHYWGRGTAADLAKTLRRGVDLTAWDGRTPQLR